MKAHYELTGEEILEHSVMTFKNMLRENQINAYIKLQIERINRADTIYALHSDYCC